MGFIHQWIMQITAVILIGSICDLLMPDGNIKKYLNPVLGFLLIFVIAKPLTTLDADNIRFDLLMESSKISGEVSSLTESTTQRNIIDIYTERLSEQIKYEIRNTYRTGAEIALSVSEDEKSFGKIQKIDVVLLLREGDFINTAAVTKTIENKFGTERNLIDIKTEVIQ